MKRSLFLLALALLLSSCGSFVSHRGDRKVAAVGREFLYESDVARLLPEGVSPEDSAAMVRRYADNWALSKIMLLKAEKELSKSDRDIDAQLDEYRRNLLSFRYEKVYIESHLDTVVSDSEIEGYYQEHLANYVFPYSVVKARVAKISPKSPYYEMILGDFNAVEQDAISSLEEMCYSSAEKYTDFSGKWIPVSVLAKETGEDVLMCESHIASGSMYEKNEDGMSYIVFVIDRVAPNDLSPVEYNRDNIRETIISRRKQDLLGRLEQELLDDAVKEKVLKIYRYDE